MGTASSSLEGVYAKLDRARVHARELTDVIGTAIDPASYDIAVNRRGNQLVYSVGTVPEVPTESSLLLGDFLTNLRAALDHLAWRLVLHDGGRPNTATKFPILRAAPMRNGVTVQPSIAGVSDQAILDNIEALQPYMGQRHGHHVEDSALFVLNELVNIDKHRLLLVIACVLSADDMWWASDTSEPQPAVRAKLAGLHDGDEIAVFDFGAAAPPTDFDPHVALDVRLDDGPSKGMARRIRLLHLVDVLYWAVEHEVVGTHFGRFFGVTNRHGYTSTSP